MPWSKEEWAILMKCTDQEGHGYAAHAELWSNHSLRYEPALCVNCRKLIDDLKEKEEVNE